MRDPGAPSDNPDTPPAGPVARAGRGSGEAGQLPLQLQSMLLSAGGVEAFLTDVARLAADTLTVTTPVACGISVQASPRSRVLGATSDKFASRMDAIQYDIGEGPCLTCLRQGVTVIVAHFATDTRWPAFAHRGRCEGGGMSMSVPMLAGQTPIGALNLYARVPGSLADADHARASQFAVQATGVVALAVRLAEREDKARHVGTALRSRSTIDRAIEILMAKTRLGADHAFELLVARSQTTNTKLRDVAAQIVAEHTDPSP